MGGVLLIDLGGVLVDVEFTRALRILALATELPVEELEKRIFDSGLKERHDSGEITSVEFYKEVLPEGGLNFCEFNQVWGTIFTEKPDVVEYVMSLTGRFKLCLASNTDPVHLDRCLCDYPWMKGIDKRGASWRLGAMKPDRNFFVQLCERLGIRPWDAVFIDDREENVVSAIGLGIRSHLFEGVDELKRFIESQ